MKTLYVSDLDGTLLRSDKRISPFTRSVLSELTAKGMHFSYATARSAYTAAMVTEGLTVKIPVILHNGTFIVENGTGRILHSNAFQKAEAESLLRMLRTYDIAPIVYSMIAQEGGERFLYATERLTPEAQRFLLAHGNDSRAYPVRSADALLRGDPFYMLCADSPEKLLPLYEKLRSTYQCVYEKEMYSGDQWLSIQPFAVSKANAVLLLKEMLGCDRIVCFGDGMNDIPMFRVADECYAMANAVPELREIATGVIESNNDDGVAKWLERLL